MPKYTRGSFINIVLWLAVILAVLYNPGGLVTANTTSQLRYILLFAAVFTIIMTLLNANIARAVAGVWLGIGILGFVLLLTNMVIFGIPPVLMIVLGIASWYFMLMHK